MLLCLPSLGKSQSTVVWESDTLLLSGELAPSFSNRMREQLIATPTVPPELGNKISQLQEKNEMGLQLTEKVLREQL